MTIARALFTSEKQDHNTPLEVLEPLRRFSSIGLDPCSNAQSIVNAATEWRLERGEDGLKRSWLGFGLAYVNWPYDDGISWARKMDAEAQRGVEIVGLGPARTDTEWFQLYVCKADAFCFWKGRLSFGAGIPDSSQLGLFAGGPRTLKEPENTAPFPSVLPYFGPRPERFKAIFEPHGWTIVQR